MSYTLNIILFYITTIALAASWVWYTKYQFQDDRGQSEGKWHPYGALARGLPFVFAFLDIEWPHILFAGSVFIFLFEIGVNKIALNQSIWYVGSTAEFDKKLGRKKWAAMVAFMIITLTLIFIIK